MPTAPRPPAPGVAVLEVRHQVRVCMTVQHEFSTVPRQRLAERRAVDQPPQMVRALARRRMVDQHDAAQVFAGAAVEQFGKPRELPGAELSARHQRRRRHRARQADQRQRPAPAQKGKHRPAPVRGFAGVIAVEIAAPMRLRVARRRPDIGVVIARHQGHVASGPEQFEPGERRGIFPRQREVHEVARHREVVVGLLLEIGDDARQHRAAVDRGRACATS